MSDIINLRSARKAKKRVEAEALAAANRVRHGRTRGERVRQAAEDDHARRRLDGALRVSGSEPDGGS